MFPLIAFSIQAAYAHAFGPTDLQNPQVIVPESSVPKWYEAGTAAHTHVVQWSGGYLHPDFDTYAMNDQDQAIFGPAASSGAPSGFAPSSLQSAYAIPALAGAKAIAIVDAYNYPTALNDFNTFSKQYGLPSETSTNATASTNTQFQIVYQGTATPATNTSWNVEEALDIEWAHAMAPNAKIYLVEANSSGLSDLFAAVQKAVKLTNVKEVSMSWGSSEFSTEIYYDYNFVSSGVVFFASTGDAAAVQEYPSESPDVVAVGGTTLNMAQGVVTSETPWASSGGGISKYETIPSFQKGVSAYVGTKRGAADVCAVANPSTGAAVYDTSGQKGWLVVGGTSLACPVVAGMTNASASFLGSSALELSKIYSGMGGANFRKITGLPAIDATHPWYFATGIGSPLGLGGL